MLRDLHVSFDKNLLVGLTTGDDAGIYRLNESTALVQTLDFFTPIVDDPFLFGQIAAANSLSDVYAMGGRPITAMNILCFPIGERDPGELAAILRGGAEKLAEAGVALVGGHSVEDAEPKFGLSVTGLIDPQHVTTNAGARPGDVIILTKALGTGIITTAAKFDSCPRESLEAACLSMATLNANASEAMRTLGIGPQLPVNACTDITGFALLGHLFHMAKASGVSLELDSSAIPLLPEVERLAAEGNVTRGGKENAAYLSNNLTVSSSVRMERLDAMLDPQTSGGLAICVRKADESRLLAELESRHIPVRAVIGRVIRQERPHITLI